MTNGALEGLHYCGAVLIPSLFPFMVLSSFLVKFGLSDKLSFVLSPFTKLFKLPGCVGLSILLSMIGGYPVGARGVVSLHQQKRITTAQAKRMSLFMVGGGPAFIVFVVGDLLLADRTLGVILWLCQVLAQLTLGILTRFSESNNKNSGTDALPKEKPLPFSNALVEACDDGVRGIFNLCGFVILFSAMLGILHNLNIEKFIGEFFSFFGVPTHTANALFPILWEVTKGCNQACVLGAPIYMLAFAIGWGGICVHFQVYAQIHTLNISKLKFTFFRLLQGVLSAVFTTLALNFYTPKIRPVFTNISNAPRHSYASSYIGSAALVIMFIFFILSVHGIRKSNAELKKSVVIK